MSVKCPRVNALIVLGVVASVVVAAACGSDDTATVQSSSTTNTTRPAASTTAPRRSLAEFAAAADAVCIATFSKVNALEDPDGVGGNKPVGLGPVVRRWANDLAAIAPPAALADDWAKATGLLRRSGIRLEDAERLAATGDSGGSDAAESEALWTLQPAAAKVITRLGVPFKACFVER